ncbi:MAG: ferritin-like domain-containing protein [Hymenobacteraceae bacterium]|nr:ferritin-like domain-containing protein [Hymenobacteraceae bacterium]MDX5396569.1 ferritin-like domain-containing protein [Hymenobacteraceae bacterium]
MKSLNDLFVHELRDVFNAELQITKALPKMAEKASNKNLVKAFEAHLKETEQHVVRLKQVFELMGLDAKGEKCKAMEGIIREGQDWMKENAEPEVMDAGLIASAQRVEHYEIAAYGTLCTYAKNLGLTDVLHLLQQNLDEEKSTDTRLSVIAETSVNKKAI